MPACLNPVPPHRRAYAPIPVGVAILLFAGLALPQAADTDTVVDIPTITASGKIGRPQANSAVASTAIKSRTLQIAGASTLSDILAEQTGLTMIQDHGTGVQMQGLSPDYTLILIDGEPAVGRTAGTLELDRFLVGDLEQIEIVKGPSSSLYGSEALAGVVNLVTRRPMKTLSFSANTRYGSYNTLQTGANLEVRRGATGLSIFADRTASSGYDLSPETRSRTAPSWEAYTFKPKMTYAYSDASRLSVSGRAYLETQRNLGTFQTDGDSIGVVERGTLTDLGLSVMFEHQISEHADITVKGYTTRYLTRTAMRLDTAGLPEDDSLVSSARFDQHLNKGEAYATLNHHPGFTALAGGGGAWESVEADRVEGGKRSAQSGFLFAQEEYSRGDFLNVQASGRLDAHRDYATTFSPRLAALVRPIPSLAFRLSVGKGFKAPTFQELYMDFTNPTVGYSVFGAQGAADALDRLDSQGQIAERLQPLNSHALSPEHSWAFNSGVDIGRGNRFSAKTSVFYNSVRDLIESRPVARKTNGQNVYTYFNLNRIQTYGVEEEILFRPLKTLTLEAGYQFLIAQDIDALDSIRAGKVYKEGRTGVIRPVQTAEYGGLFNRSRHSGNLKATWDGTVFETETTAALRVLMRGRYGYADRNGNGILDSDAEYEHGYALWNVSFSIRPLRHLSLDTRIDNIFDEVRPLVPLPGRLIYAGFRVHSF